MNLNFNIALVSNYKNLSQKIRVVSEDWTKREIFCPNCGNQLFQLKNNNPVGDFICKTCEETFELKSKKNSFGYKINDGAYSKIIEKLADDKLPNFFLLTYDLNNSLITNFVLIPKHFFSFSIIEKRKALSETAIRSGWIGCNILFEKISESGKIYYVKDKISATKEDVQKNWKKTLFIRENKNIELRGWSLDIIKCIDQIGKVEFSLNDIYKFEEYLKLNHPDNKFIKDKIRQQLQYLRDKGFLKFLGNGKYRRV